MNSFIEAPRGNFKFGVIWVILFCVSRIIWLRTLSSLTFRWEVPRSQIKKLKSSLCHSVYIGVSKLYSYMLFDKLMKFYNTVSFKPRSLKWSECCCSHFLTFSLKCSWHVIATLRSSLKEKKREPDTVFFKNTSWRLLWILSVFFSSSFLHTFQK